MRSDELENQQYLGRSEMSEMDYMRQELVRLQEQVASQDADLQKLRQQLSLPGAASANAGQPSLTSRRTMLRRVGSAAAGIAALSLAAGLNPAAALADEPAIDADGTGGATASYGGQFKGDLAQLRLVPATTAGGRTAGTHAAGELYVDTDNNLYYRDGTGWNQLNTQTQYLPNPLRLVGAGNDAFTNLPTIPGVDAQGAFQPVYYPIAGFTVNNTNLRTGAKYSGSIPAAAKGVIGTVTVAAAVGGGYIIVFPGDLTASQVPFVASINYPASSTLFALSNAVSVKLGTIPSGTYAGQLGIGFASLQQCQIGFDVIGYTY